MYFIESYSTNPYFNIAMEEYLLREKQDDFFILYVDEPSVIVGKHQNTLAEVNYRYIIENNIPVIRRISGGGTVFHDSGNLNFCFIANSQEGYQIDFKKYIRPVTEVLNNVYGIPATIGGKNDIRVNDLKVSGNAEHVFKNRVLHHGTLLVNSDLVNLSQAIKVVPDRYFDKAVKSIRSKVANLSSFNPIINIENLKQNLFSSLNASFPLKKNILSAEEEAIVKQKVQEKFQTWEWDYAYSPAYTFQADGIELHIENGIIKSAKISGAPELAKKIIGKAHEYNEIKKYREDVWSFF